jgi:osmotically-inducible protein OsmY
MKHRSHYNSNSERHYNSHEGDFNHASYERKKRDHHHWPYTGSGYDQGRSEFYAPVNAYSKSQRSNLSDDISSNYDRTSSYKENYRSLGEGHPDGDESATWNPPRSNHHGVRKNQGKGPRSFKRTDDRIMEIINDRLMEDAYVDASDVEVSVRDGNVVLTGTVHSREARYRAEDIAFSVAGVQQIENRLRVSR